MNARRIVLAVLAIASLTIGMYAQGRRSSTRRRRGGSRTRAAAVVAAVAVRSQR